MDDAIRYLVSLILSWPASFIFGNDIGCSIILLRFTNALMAIILFFVLYKILRLDKRTEQGAALSALSLTLFPVLWIFHFLYYTDTGSLLFLSFGLYFTYKKRFWASASVRICIQCLMTMPGLLNCMFVPTNKYCLVRFHFMRCIIIYERII